MYGLVSLDPGKASSPLRQRFLPFVRDDDDVDAASEGGFVCGAHGSAVRGRRPPPTKL